jgi:hypothetical protein
VCARKRLKSSLIGGLKATATILLLWLAFRQVSWQQLREALLRVSPSLATAAVLLYQLGAIIPDSVRLAACGAALSAPRVPLLSWIRLYLESRPWFYLLPASAAADGFLWVQLKGRTWRMQDIASLLMLNRLWGVGVWAVAGGAALAWDPAHHVAFRDHLALLGMPWLWFLVGLAGIGSAAFGPRLLKRWFPNIGRANLRASALALCSTLVGALLLTAAACVAARAAGAPMAFLTCLGLLAWFNFGMALPISFGGLGIQEGLVLLLGRPAGTPVQDLLVFSMLLHGLRIVLAIAGAIVSLAKAGLVASRTRSS